MVVVLGWRWLGLLGRWTENDARWSTLVSDDAIA